MTNSTTVKLCGRCKTRPRQYPDGVIPSTGTVTGNTYCRECKTAWTRESRRANPERETKHHRKYLLKARYKMTSEEYEQKLESQGGVCACCGRGPSGRKLLNVDHDHACCPGRDSCGKCVRDLLCDDCNLLVGRFELGHLARVFAYLGVEVR